MKRKILLLVVSLLLTLMICEVVLRFLAHRSENSHGAFLDLQFPSNEILPIDQIISPEDKLLTRNIWYNSLIVNGKKITKGDLWGILREDDLLGFTAKENAVSTNGWWQSNNIGARSNQPTLPAKSPLRKRILLFGDSYAQCSRVPQDETIDFYLNEGEPNMEVVNFGVDGYGIAQSYLRFKTLKNQLAFDRVFLIFVPRADLEREINVSRYVGLGWFSSLAIKIQPRFAIEDGELALIQSPYKNLEELLKDNHDYISDRLKKHLRKYDSYYFEFWHDTTPGLDNLLIVKLIKHELYKRKKRSINQNIMNTDSESVQVTKKIVEAMDEEVREDGGEFSLIILPSIWDINFYSSDPDFKKKWNEMVFEICSARINCLDLMKDFQKIPVESFDTGYDGTHYGPKTNSLIADFIRQKALH